MSEAQTADRSQRATGGQQRMCIHVTRGSALLLAHSLGQGTVVVAMRAPRPAILIRTIRYERLARYLLNVCIRT